MDVAATLAQSSVLTLIVFELAVIDIRCARAMLTRAHSTCRVPRERILFVAEPLPEARHDDHLRGRARRPSRACRSAASATTSRARSARSTSARPCRQVAPRSDLRKDMRELAAHRATAPGRRSAGREQATRRHDHPTPTRSRPTAGRATCTSARTSRLRVQRAADGDARPRRGAEACPCQELRDECLRRVDLLLNEQRTPLTTAEKQQLLREVMDEIFGLGPIEELLRDPAISDILVNGPNQIYVEREGRLELLERALPRRGAPDAGDPAHRRAASAAASTSARRCSTRACPDGSRVNAIIPPLVAGAARR